MSIRNISFKVCFPILMFLSFHFSSYGYQLRGKVTDKKTGEALPYVNVYLQNSTYGVTTNLEGEYFIELQAGHYTILFSYIGYEPYAIEIDITGNIYRSVRLSKQSMDLESVDVNVKRKRDYSYEVIQNVIKNKSKYDHPYETYQCNAYIKSSLEKTSIETDSTLIDSIYIYSEKPTIEKMDFVEAYSTLYFKNRNTNKEVKSGYRDFSKKYSTEQAVTINVEYENYGSQSMINPNLFKINLSDGYFNFYDNFMSIPALGEVPFTSPVSSTAMISYKFRFAGDFEENGYIIDKIEVIPRNNSGALFKGYIYVIEDLWCLKSVDLEINKAGLLSYDFFKVMLNYSLEENKYWVTSREEFFYHTKFLGDTLMGNTLINYSGFSFNNDYGKRFFGNEQHVITDEAVDRDSSYWDSIRPITLKEEEVSFIHTEDSIKKHEQSKEYLKRQDSIYNTLNFWSFVATGIHYRNSFKKFEIYFSPLTEQINIFGVGGYRHRLFGGIEKSWKKENAIELNYQIDYGIANKDIKGYFNPKYMYAPKKFGKVKIGMGKTFDVINNYESLEASFSRGNYIQSLSFSAGNEIEVVNGLYTDANLEYTEKRSIAGYTLSDWSNQLFGDNNIPVDFTGYNQVIFDLKLKIRYKQKYGLEPYKKIVLGSRFPKLDIHYKKGFKGILESDVDFDFIELKLHDEIKFAAFGESKYRVFIGKFVNGKEVKFTDYKFFRGSDRFIFSNPLRSFQLMDTVRISTKNAYLHANYLHHFNGTLLNKIPILKKMKLQSVGGVGILTTEDSNFRHAEIFVGIEKPFKLWRQVFKFGTYYVISDSNFSKVDAKFKFGIDIYNPWSKSWSY